MRILGIAGFGARRRAAEQPTRRSIAAQRQRRLHTEDALFEGAYAKHRNLNTASTTTPAETSHRLAMHQLLSRRRRLRFHLTWLLLCLAVVGVLIMQFMATVRVVTPAATPASHTERYQQIVESYLASRPVERFRFMLRTDDLRAFFLEKAPEVHTIRLEGGGAATAVAKLTFRRPVVQWSSGDTRYFVDEHGVTFKKAFGASPAIVVKDESGIPTSNGQEVINRQALSFMGQVVAECRERQLTVSEIILPEHSVRQVLISLQGKPYKLKMTVDRSAKAQVEQAAKAVQFVAARQLVPSYLDVRVDQRVFYK